MTQVTGGQEDEEGWRKPRAGTQARAVYDLYRTGMDSPQIAERIGRRRNYVSVVISQFGWRDLAPGKVDCSKNQDAGVRGSEDWKQRISEGVRKAYAEGRVVKGLAMMALPSRRPRPSPGRSRPTGAGWATTV